MTDRDSGAKDIFPMTDSERAEWERIFRENVRHLPSTAEKWFSLGNGIDEPGEKPDPNFQPSQQFKDYLESLAEDVNRLIHNGKSNEAVSDVDSRLSTVQNEFSDNEGELRKIKGRLFHARGSAQGYLIEHGSFQLLPHGNKLRSLASLSAGVDYMKSDIQYGYVTRAGRAISECFGYAEMQVLQHRAVEKTFGGGTELVYRNTLRPIPRLSAPQDREIADLQRRVVNRIQGLM